MANVIPFRLKTTPRPPEHPDCKRALFLLIEARGVLRRLVERGEVEEGSPPEMTLEYLDEAIGMLDYEDEPTG